MNEQGDAGTSNASNTEDIANYQRKMELLKPIERRTAQAFLECEIYRDYCWPLPNETKEAEEIRNCLLYTSPSPRDLSTSRMPSSA